MTLADDWGAFLPGPRCAVPGAVNGPLHGVRVAVKDLIDVAGWITGGGNPDWAAGQQAATRHAAAVQRLLDAGGQIVGKTLTDELAFSLEGENAHFGTPRNPAAPGRLPGGSSSGSAVAVAAGLADLALGTDTGGSVRIPAAFCGVFGFRPTHGRVPLAGVLPFAPSLDTVGWFARDGELLQRAGSVLLDAPANPRPTLRLRWAQDIAALGDAGVSATVHLAADALACGGAGDLLPDAPDRLLGAYAVLQGDEIRTTLGPWVQAQRPRFGPTIAPRFASIFAIDARSVQDAQALRESVRAGLDATLAHTAWLFPTAPCIALPLDAAPAVRDRFYATALAVNALAGLAGLPQVTMPAGRVDGAPVGLSVLGPRGSDEALLVLAAAWRVQP